MTYKKQDNTEQRILQAARTIFIKKGMDGARMQEIADEAGINKALLHYYFRSKQKLFEAIFEDLFRQIFPNLQILISSNDEIDKKLGAFLDGYISVLQKNPYLPVFILKEINRDPHFFTSIFKAQNIQPQLLSGLFEKEMSTGKVVQMDARELMINILSLCIFPFAAKPLLELVLFENDTEAYNRFLEERKTSIKYFILNSILIK